MAGCDTVLKCEIVCLDPLPVIWVCYYIKFVISGIEKNALTEHTVFRSHCVRGNELLRNRAIEVNDMAGVKLYSVVFLLVVASKISCQGM